MSSYTYTPKSLQVVGKKTIEPTALTAFLGGFFLFLQCLLLLVLGLALWTYSPLDPGFSTTGVGEQVLNFAGIAGAWFADLALFTFGFSVWWFWLLFIRYWFLSVYSWLCLLRGKPKPIPLFAPWQRWVGSVLLILSSCTLEWSRIYAWGAYLPDKAGGVLGYTLGVWGEYFLTFNGLALIVIPLMLFALSWAFAFSWDKVAILMGMLLESMVLSIRKYREYKEDIRLGVKATQERRADVFVEDQDTDTTNDLATDKRPLVSNHEKLTTTPSQAYQLPTAIPIKTKSYKKETIVPLLDALPVGNLPHTDLLDPVNSQDFTVTPETLEMTSRLIEKKLKDFGVSVRVMLALPGPVVTRYEIEPATGVKGSQVVNLAKDLARSLSLVSIRVIETIPGKNYMALELPNFKRQTISLAEVLGSAVYLQAKSLLTLGLGKDIVGEPVVANLAKMPHCLVAGTTGSGKSVGINAMLLSLLYKAEASDVRLLLIDPKMLELSVYEGIPHLITPVVTDMQQVPNALNWCVAEMEKRYKLMSKMGVRNLLGFNRKIDEAHKQGEAIVNPFSINPEQPEALERLPHIVVIIDELADLMMIAGKKIESLIARLAQKARAAGIHLILATQRPSVDVITGLIKANIPTRIAFQVSSKIDSRTILDQMGAETLLGMGDMLYMASGTGLPIRVHGAFVSDDEVHRVVEYLKTQGEPNYIEGVLEGGTTEETGLATENTGGSGEKDTLYDQAVAIVLKNRKASISLVQRHLKIGYNRAARLLEDMENAGLVSSMSGSGQREILVPDRNA
jgi:S-DNA-T family DNA segregation ATPase FtsK/SpoIIIE